MCSRQNHMADQFAVISSQVVQGGDVLAWNNQHMGGSLWVYIAEGDQSVVFMHNVRWDLFGNDFAKYAVHTRPRIREPLTMGKPSMAEFCRGMRIKKETGVSREEPERLLNPARLTKGGYSEITGKKG